MEINNQTLAKLKSLDETQLREAISDIADALGATPAQKRRALNNTRNIKRRIMGATENDLKSIVGKIDESQQEQIARKLKF